MNPTNASSEYILLFRGPDWDRGQTVDEIQRRLDRAMAWFEALDREGKVKASQALDGMGCVVSGNKGRALTDGPFAESKEVIGGYLLLRAASLDEAIAIAQTCPTLEYGISVEVRPTLLECPVGKRLRERQLEATV